MSSGILDLTSAASTLTNLSPSTNAKALRIRITGARAQNGTGTFGGTRSPLLHTRTLARSSPARPSLPQHLRHHPAHSLRDAVILLPPRLPKVVCRGGLDEGGGSMDRSKYGKRNPDTWQRQDVWQRSRGAAGPEEAARALAARPSTVVLEKSGAGAASAAGAAAAAAASAAAATAGAGPPQLVWPGRRPGRLPSLPLLLRRFRPSLGGKGRALTASPLAIVALTGASVAALLLLLTRQAPRLPVVDGGQVMAAMSKFLGCMVIVGSTVLKVPQIVRILRNKSVRGLNPLSFEVECVGYTIALAYCLRSQVPFSAYGELFFILAQEIVLVALLYCFSRSQTPILRWIKVPLYLAAAWLLFLGDVNRTLLEVLYNGQTTMFTLARMPQIWTNFKACSTGELSLATSILSVTGCAARLFTSIQERAPHSMVVSSITGLASHGTLLTQILFYSSNNKSLRSKRAHDSQKPLVSHPVPANAHATAPTNRQE